MICYLGFFVKLGPEGNSSENKKGEGFYEKAMKELEDEFKESSKGFFDFKLGYREFNNLLKKKKKEMGNLSLTS